jgi:hypothetical protein
MSDVNNAALVSIETPPAHDRDSCRQGGWLAERPYGLTKLSLGKNEAPENVGTNGKRVADEQFGSNAEVAAEHEMQFVMG